MQPSIQPGDVSPRVRTLIISACVVTIALAFYGMQAMWEFVEWVEEPYFTDSIEFGRNAFWYTNGVGFAVCAAIAVVWWPRFRIAQLLRVAVALPIIHVGALVLAAHAWSILEGDLLIRLSQLESPSPSAVPQIAVPSVGVLAIGFAAMVVVGIAIKRRHGEWAHATMMLALSFLLLVGLWLPLLSRLAVEKSPMWSWTYDRVLDADAVAARAIIPAGVIAIGFVAFVFLAPQLFERFRSRIRTVVIVVFTLAVLFATSLPDRAWLVYLESSYLVMSALILAVAALLLLGGVSVVQLLCARWRSRRFTYQDGVIAADEEGEVARFEITSWLRGPRLTSRPFVVTTPRGNVPITGAKLIVTLPLATTTLDVGDHAPVMARGDRVVIASRKIETDGHPFRASDAAEVVSVAAADAHASRLGDIVLVLWRPAVAYLAIVVAVALPYLSIVLTD